MKFGMHENSTNRSKVAELLRFDTSKTWDEQINFKDDVDRMKGWQDDISYITGESIAIGSSFLFLEYMLKEGSLRYLIWWTSWMSMPRNSSRSSTERS